MDTLVEGAVLLGGENRLKDFSAVRVQTGFVFDSGSGNRLTKCRIAVTALQGIGARPGVTGARSLALGNDQSGVVITGGSPERSQDQCPAASRTRQGLASASDAVPHVQPVADQQPQTFDP